MARLPSSRAPDQACCAVFHPVQTVATCSAGPADLGAFAANMLVVRGIARHEVERHGADLGAVEHELHMRRLGMFSAHLEAMGHCHRQTHHMAFVTGVHALFHVGVGMRHHSSPAPPEPVTQPSHFSLLPLTSSERASGSADRIRPKGSSPATRNLGKGKKSLDSDMMSDLISGSVGKGEGYDPSQRSDARGP